MRRAPLVGWVGLVTWTWLPTVGRVAAEPQPDFATVVRSLGAGARARPAAGGARDRMAVPMLPPICVS